MFRSILPQEFAFFDFFDDMIGKANELTNVLLKASKKEIPLEEAVNQIKSYESAMDAIESQCIEALHKTFITPLERPDILKLIHTLDSIADNVYQASSRMILYKIDMRDDVQNIAEILVKATEELKIAIHSLKNFKNAELIKKQCATVRKFESEGDKIFKKAISSLFETNDAILIIKCKEVYERFEKAINKCEDTANIIEEILIESA